MGFYNFGGGIGEDKLLNENMESVMMKFNKTKAWNLPVIENGWADPLIRMASG